MDEALESLKENNHVTGYHRADTDAEFIELLGEAGYAWISNENIFQYVSYYPDQRSRLYIGNPNDGYSLIPVFDN